MGVRRRGVALRRGRNDPEIEVRRRGAPEDDAAPVGRPCGLAVAGVCRQPAWATSVRVDHPDARLAGDSAGEGDPHAAGRPRSLLPAAGEQPPPLSRRKDRVQLRRLSRERRAGRSGRRSAPPTARQPPPSRTAPTRQRARRSQSGASASRNEFSLPVVRIHGVTCYEIGTGNVRVAAYSWRSMGQPAPKFACSDCGHSTGRWLGKCPGCGELRDARRGGATGRRERSQGRRPRTVLRLVDVEAEEAERIPTGVAGARPRARRRARPRVARARRRRARRRQVDAAAHRRSRAISPEPPRAARHRRGVGRAGEAPRRAARRRRATSRSSPRPSSTPSARRSSASGPTSA